MPKRGKQIFKDVDDASLPTLLADLKQRAPEAFDSQGNLIARSSKFKVDDRVIDIPFDVLLANRLESRKKNKGTHGEVPIRREHSIGVFSMLMDSLAFDNEVIYEIREKDGWEPSYKEPIPRIRCTNKAKQGGEQCRITAYRGSLLCYKHGGKELNNRKAQAEAIEAARLRLMNMTDMAIDVVKDMLEDPEVNANTRLKAAQDVMDRAGLKPGVEMTLEVNHNHNIASEMRDQMLNMRESRPPEIENIVEAEIVSQD